MTELSFRNMCELFINSFSDLFEKPTLVNPSSFCWNLQSTSDRFEALQTASTPFHQPLQAISSHSTRYWRVMKGSIITYIRHTGGQSSGAEQNGSASGYGKASGDPQAWNSQDDAGTSCSEFSIRHSHSSAHPSDGNDGSTNDCGQSALVTGPSWSVGAAKHDAGNCRPCVWNWRESGCSKGEACAYCHMCTTEMVEHCTKTRKAKAALNKKKMMKEANAKARGFGDSPLNHSGSAEPALDEVSSQSSTSVSASLDVQPTNTVKGQV